MSGAPPDLFFLRIPTATASADTEHVVLTRLGFRGSARALEWLHLGSGRLALHDPRRFYFIPKVKDPDRSRRRWRDHGRRPRLASIRTPRKLEVFRTAPATRRASSICDQTRRHFCGAPVSFRTFSTWHLAGSTAVRAASLAQWLMVSCRIFRARDCPPSWIGGTYRRPTQESLSIRVTNGPKSGGAGLSGQRPSKHSLNCDRLRPLSAPT